MQIKTILALSLIISVVLVGKYNNDERKKSLKPVVNKQQQQQSPTIVKGVENNNVKVVEISRPSDDNLPDLELDCDQYNTGDGFRDKKLGICRYKDDSFNVTTQQQISDDKEIRKLQNETKKEVKDVQGKTQAKKEEVKICDEMIRRCTWKVTVNGTRALDCRIEMLCA